MSAEITGRNCDWAFEFKGPDSRRCQTCIKSNLKIGTFVQIFSTTYFWVLRNENIIDASADVGSHFILAGKKGILLNKRHFMIVFRFGCDVRELKPIKALQPERAKVRG